jgi:hypothetical protein
MAIPDPIQKWGFTLVPIEITECPHCGRTKGLVPGQGCPNPSCGRPVPMPPVHITTVLCPHCRNTKFDLSAALMEKERSHYSPICTKCRGELLMDVHRDYVISFRKFMGHDVEIKQAESQKYVWAFACFLLTLAIKQSKAVANRYHSRLPEEISAWLKAGPKKGHIPQWVVDEAMSEAWEHPAELLGVNTEASIERDNILSMKSIPKPTGRLPFGVRLGANWNDKSVMDWSDARGKLALVNLFKYAGFYTLPIEVEGALNQNTFDTLNQMLQTWFGIKNYEAIMRWDLVFQTPNPAAFHELITKSFDDPALIKFCHTHFKEVYDRFGGQSKDVKVSLLKEYLDQKRYFGRFAWLISQIEPALYERFADSLYYDK